MSSLQTSWGKLQAQKSPQGLRRAGFQDFIGLAESDLIC